MPLTATPLSQIWTKKGAVDHVRAIVSELDDQTVTDDNIAAHIQAAAFQLYKLYPPFRDFYIFPIPFTMEETLSADPSLMTNLLPPAGSNYRFPYRITQGVGAPLAFATPQYPTGMYSHHYQKPENFHVLEWKALFNTRTGSCRETSDYTQLMGDAMGNNTQIAKTVMWYAFGPDLWVVVREGMPSDCICVGLAVRSMIPLLRYVKTDTPTGLQTDNPATTMDERSRYIFEDNDWEFLDVPDQYAPLVFNLASIKAWGQVGKTPQEGVEAQVNTQLAQLDPTLEMADFQRRRARKDDLWKDRGHL